MVFESTVEFTIRQSEERRRDDESATARRSGEAMKKNLVGSHICRTVVRLEKTAQRGHCREKKPSTSRACRGRFSSHERWIAGKRNHAPKCAKHDSRYVSVTQ